MHRLSLIIMPVITIVKCAYRRFFACLCIGILLGSKKLKQEALDETVFRVREALRVAQPKIPYCVFNGGKDAWVDIGT